MLIATFQKLQRCKYAAGELIYRFTVDPPHGRSAPGRSAPFTGRSAPPSWSIRPVEFEGRKDRGNGADRPVNGADRPGADRPWGGSTVNR